MTGRRSSWMVLFGCSVVLPGLFTEVRPAAAQPQLECHRPEGVDEAPTPRIIASEVDANPTPANLMSFALEARDYRQDLSRDELAYASCVFRLEGDWKSGSMYVATLDVHGTVLRHHGNMALSGRELREEVFMAIVATAGFDTGTQSFTNPDGGVLDMPLSGYAVGFHSIFNAPSILTAGFDIQESHLKPVVFDPADTPAVTASDVTDRESLKAFVNGAIEFVSNVYASEGTRAVTRMKSAFRQEEGPWRDGSVYLYTLDTTGYVWFHAAFPQQFELVLATGRYLDAVTGKPIFLKIIEAAQSNPDGAFVEYHFDDTADDSDSAEIPKTAFVRMYSFPGLENILPPFIFGSGFYGPSTGTDTMTQFVPVVLNAGGKNNSHFTSELALTNRGSNAAMINFTYTAEEGGGSGAATGMLGPHQQMIASDAIDYLRSLDVPIPGSGNRVGTLRVDVSGSSDVSAVVRTTTPTAVPEGRAGLAYPGVPEDMGFHEEAVYLCGLRDNPGDRSNVAVQNMGSEGSITLRITAFSGNPTDPSGEVAWEDTLGPGEFHQVNTVLTSAGKADPVFGGYVRVERVEGMAPFYAYGVINDNANSDGSFVFPVTTASLEGAKGQTLPVVVERGSFTSELTVTNFSDEDKTVNLSLVADAVQTDDYTSTFSLLLAAGQQHIIPSVIEAVRQSGASGLGPGIAGPLFITAAGADMSGIVIGARTGSQADPGDMSKGQYGVFYTAVPRGAGFTDSAWVTGLQQNEENRSNLALVNPGEVDNSPSVFNLDIYDGETSMLVSTVIGVAVGARDWHQIDGILRNHAPGTTQGYVRIRKVSGANPFLAYGVVNDGGAPGQRTGDGAYIPARE